MADLGQAYVQIVPSAKGISGAIQGVLDPEAASAGQSAGTKIGQSIGDFAKKAIVALGVGKIISDSISNGMNFDEMSAKASTLFSGTAEEFKNLQSEIMGISNETGVAASELMNAAYSAESASVPMGNLGGMIKASSQLATAGFTDIDTALSATAKTMNAYGMMSDDVTATQANMEAVQRVLIQTQNKGITTVGELGASLAQVTPTAASAGVGFDQVGASLALLTAQGTPTAQATTQLRSAIAELSKSGTKASDALQAAAEGTEYAGMSFTQMMDSGATLGDVMGMLQAHADDTGVSMLDLWSSIEGGNAAQSIAANLDTFSSDLEAMGTNADVVGDAYSTMADTASNKLNKLKTNLTNLGIKAFMGVADGLVSVFDGLLKIIEGVSPSAKKLGSAFMTLVTTFGQAAGKAMGLNGDFSLTDAIISGLTTVIDGLATVFNFLAQHMDIVAPIVLGVITAFAGFKALSIVTTIVKGIALVFGLLASPIGIAVAAIAAAIAIGVALYKNWDTIKATASTVWNAIKTTISNVLTGIKTTVTNVWNAIKTAISNTVIAIKGKIASVWSAIKTNVTSVVNGIKTTVTNVWNAIKTAISNTVTAIKTNVSSIWNAIKSTTSSVFNGVKSVASSVWNGIKNTITAVVNGVKTKVQSVWNGIKSTTSSIFNGVKSTVSSIWNGIKSTITNVVSGIKSNVSSAFNGIKSSISSSLNGAKSTVTNVFNSIKSGITEKINAAKSAVTSAVNKIRSAMHFSWKLPSLKLPHISITGHFSINPPSTPHFAISWKKKGAIVDGASVVGVGEAGPEAIVPLSGRQMRPFAEAIAEEMGGTGSDREVLELLREYLPMLANMKVMLDRGTLVGQLAPAMDARIGSIAARRSRGN